jgi:hypothetical protein
VKAGDGPFRGRRSLARAVLVLGSVLWSHGVLGGGGDASTAADIIRFDLSVLGESGLYGPSDGLRALHYEFCIPDRSDAIAQVRRIDASVLVQRAPGRIGCSNTQLLCIGSTHQPGYRRVLAALADLPYVVRIEQSFFE